MWFFKKSKLIFACVKYGIHRNVKDSESGYWYIVNEKDNVKPGDWVIVPVGEKDENYEATVIKVGEYNKSTAPYPVKDAKKIITNLTNDVAVGKKPEYKLRLELVGNISEKLDELVFKDCLNGDCYVVNLELDNFGVKLIETKTSDNSGILNIVGDARIVDQDVPCGISVSLEYLKDYDTLIISGKVTGKEVNKNIYESISKINLKAKISK